MEDSIKEKIEKEFDDFLIENFGLFLTRQEPMIVRRATGPRWIAKVYVVGFDDLEVGELEADDLGNLLNGPTPDSVVKSIKHWLEYNELQDTLEKDTDDPFAEIGEELSSLFEEENEHNRGQLLKK